MDRKFKECLNNEYGSYILPFLWLHGEPKERVREEILAIKNSGINEFCAESRPYEHFCQDEWWDDFGFILKTARELGMRVWLLDDKKFPSGYANGYLEKEENAHLRKKLIRELQIDVIGPMKNTKLFVGGRMNENERIISVVAYKRTENGEELDAQSAVILTDKVTNGMAYWDIPSGLWRVCITIETAPYEYQNDRLFYYIDMLNPDSCHAMLDAIYEPHYEHFAEYFGNTFAGFFSDEPAFLNVCYTYNNTPGIMYSPYPWRSDLPSLMADNKYSANEIARYLPALWENLGEINADIRTRYMDVITRLYRDNFSYQLGNWCREHGVMYIGHVIEDMGAHMRMGYGSGHFFRALDGQDMAGIDIVLHQDIPGISNAIHRSPLADGGMADPAFFRYTLPKLASSHSHIQELKKGRAMCEIFGAFGWAEGLPFMKKLADIMLASGINHFVPHAFSPLEEDTDCPPHFYNGGNNIQYPFFKDLISYMSRCSHMLSDSVHMPDVAVLYNAEMEWSTEKHEAINEICKALTQNLIDFDIIPYDALSSAEIKNNRLEINGESYGALIVPGASYMPFDMSSTFDTLAMRGLPVIITDYTPIKYCEGYPTEEQHNYTCIPFSRLCESIRQRGLAQLSFVKREVKSLKFYHVTRDKKDIYLFSNEDANNAINSAVSIKQSGECLIYDPWENKYYRTSTANGVLNLHLDSGNTLFVIFGESIPSGTPEYTVEAERISLPLRFEIAIKKEGSDDFTVIAENSECFDISAPDNFPDFSGDIRYRAFFESKDDFDVIDLGQTGEVARVFLNDTYIGTRINAPYKFDLSKACYPGRNYIEITVTNNLAHKRHDDLSSFIQIPPSGIIGDICLCRYEELNARAEHLNELEMQDDIFLFDITENEQKPSALEFILKTEENMKVRGDVKTTVELNMIMYEYIVGVSRITDYNTIPSDFDDYEWQNQEYVCLKPGTAMSDEINIPNFPGEFHVYLLSDEATPITDSYTYNKVVREYKNKFERFLDLEEARILHGSTSREPLIDIENLVTNINDEPLF